MAARAFRDLGDANLEPLTRVQAEEEVGGAVGHDDVHGGTERVKVP